MYWDHRNNEVATVSLPVKRLARRLHFNTLKDHERINCQGSARCPSPHFLEGDSLDKCGLAVIWRHHCSQYHSSYSYCINVQLSRQIFFLHISSWVSHNRDNCGDSRRWNRPRVFGHEKANWEIVHYYWRQRSRWDTSYIHYHWPLYLINHDHNRWMNPHPYYSRCCNS